MPSETPTGKRFGCTLDLLSIVFAGCDMQRRGDSDPPPVMVIPGEVGRLVGGAAHSGAEVPPAPR